MYSHMIGRSDIVTAFSKYALECLKLATTGVSTDHSHVQINFFDS